ncbi:MAG TPA: heme-binding domain-containing protein [Caldilineae bacterium]|nr:heme-binding domain-containing protein [Caldilineae bacterium]
MSRKIVLAGVLVILLLCLIIQVIPYGRRHSNPSVLAEPNWDSPRTRELFFRACADCHSNETVWPWYSNIAPVSWLIQRDVEEGRAAFNVSEWGRPGENEGEEAAEAVREGSMPPALYVLLHPRARLSASEKDEFVRGLIATFGKEAEGEEED